MLTNSLLAGALGAAYLTILVLQLNPQVPLWSYSVLHWYATLGAFYGLHLALLFYVVMLLREMVSLDAFRPGWISVRLLAWLSAVAAAVAALLMWLNRQGLAAVFTETDLRRLTIGAAATTASAVVLLGIAIAHYSFGRHGSRVGAALLGIAITGSLALPVAARGVGGALPLGGRRVSIATAPFSAAGPRVLLVALDGASLDYILPRAAEGRLPNFGRLLDRGAFFDLATIRPTQPDPVWAAAATGIYPSKNGVRSAASYFARGDDRPVDLLPEHCFSHVLVHLGIIRDQPNSSIAWRARPLWTILGDYGISSGIVRWPLTYPAEPIRGFLVTDRFHQLVGSMFEFDGRAAYPSELEPVVREAFNESGEPASDPLAIGVAAPEAAAARRDRFYSHALQSLAAERPVRFSTIRYQALDTIGHRYLRYVQPGSFENVSDEERQKYGGILDRYYAYVDAEVGRAIEGLTPGDLLLVVSGFGMQPVDPLKHVLARITRQPDLSGTHDRAPDGFLFAYGTAVEPGRHQRGSIVDVAPTVLYYLGVPIGRDMDGYARADLFAKAFTVERPITFIPSHGR